ncbi:hypothetical protein HMPREF1982_01783 [Clostridiales bacterium oral taxon 876 str. F0540]|nr:hypothetical protein HMPREF1982_01783 [Clostridiales bacterium oral taxon 876 str. F0540]
MANNDLITYKAEVWDIMQHTFGRFNDHQLHCVVYFDKHIDEACFKRAVNISADIFPIIRCKFVGNSYFKFPYWEDCGFTAEDMVKIMETNDMQKTIEESLIVNTRENCGPQIILNIIRSKNCDCLCIVMNHMIADGAGFKEYLYMISSIYSNLKNNPDFKLHKKMMNRSTKQIFKKFTPLEKAKILLGSANLSKYNSGITFLLEGAEGNPFMVIRKIPRDRFFLIRDYAKRNNATINDALLAAYIRAINKVIKFEHISIPCAVDLRKYLPDRQAEGICNLTSNMICDIDYSDGEAYEETLMNVKKSMDSEKENLSCLKGPLMLEIIFNMLPYNKARQLVSKNFSNPPIAITNIGVIDKNKLVFEGLSVKDAFINGSIKYKPYFQAAVTTFNDEITLSINFSGTERDRIRIKEFLSLFDKELQL